MKNPRKPAARVVGAMLPRVLCLSAAVMAIEGGGQEVQAQCTASWCDEGWDTITWTGDGATDDWTDVDNWDPDTYYPGENDKDYCVVITDDSTRDTVFIDDVTIEIRTLRIGADMTVKLLTGSELTLFAHDGNPATAGSGPNSLCCDGELWISCGDSTGDAEDRPAELSLDGGQGGSGDPYVFDDDKASVLNGTIKFFQEGGAGTDPGLIGMTECTRFISHNTYNGSIVGDVLGELDDTSIFDTFNISDEITISGAMNINSYIWDFTIADMGTIDADTSGKTITVGGSAKEAMGIWRASGGTLKIDKSITGAGAGTWDLDSGTIWFTSNAATSVLTGQLNISSGTLDVDGNVETSGKAVIDGTCTITVASGKTFIADGGVEIGGGSAVTVTRSGVGTFATETSGL